mmetsp:Transcript_26358/g.78767  ORF Transcript_26358/g.78767 Transcript_26358/m.78767 type:complete len:249 (-) Transcript_26358:24-770(-)
MLCISCGCSCSSANCSTGLGQSSPEASTGMSSYASRFVAASSGFGGGGPGGRSGRPPILPPPAPPAPPAPSPAAPWILQPRGMPQQRYCSASRLSARCSLVACLDVSPAALSSLLPLGCSPLPLVPLSAAHPCGRAGKPGESPDAAAEAPRSTTCCKPRTHTPCGRMRATAPGGVRHFVYHPTAHVAQRGVSRLPSRCAVAVCSLLASKSRRRRFCAWHRFLRRRLRAILGCHADGLRFAQWPPRPVA